LLGLASQYQQVTKWHGLRPGMPWAADAGERATVAT
jgi:hypothetical protein